MFLFSASSERNRLLVSGIVRNVAECFDSPVFSHLKTLLVHCSTFFFYHLTTEISESNFNQILTILIFTNPPFVRLLVELSVMLPTACYYRLIKHNFAILTG